MAEKKKTTKTKSVKTATLPLKKDKKEEIIKEEEPVYSYTELADKFGTSVMKMRAYFNMSQLDYSQKITIKKARELFNKF